jgi:hypothetical protein
LQLSAVAAARLKTYKKTQVTVVLAVVVRFVIFWHAIKQAAVVIKETTI